MEEDGGDNNADVRAVSVNTRHARCNFPARCGLSSAFLDLIYIDDKNRRGRNVLGPDQIISSYSLNHATAGIILLERWPGSI